MSNLTHEIEFTSTVLGTCIVEVEVQRGRVSVVSVLETEHAPMWEVEPGDLPDEDYDLIVAALADQV